MGYFEKVKKRIKDSYDYEQSSVLSVTFIQKSSSYDDKLKIFDPYVFTMPPDFNGGHC